VVTGRQECNDRLRRGLAFAIAAHGELLMPTQSTPTTPLVITFQGCDASDLVRATAAREYARLETHDHRISSGKVTVIGPSEHHRHGAGFQVHILLTMPPHDNIVVSHAGSDGRRNDRADVAVKDAFAVARRRIDDSRQN
jgi:hypothetical protein